MRSFRDRVIDVLVAALPLLLSARIAHAQVTRPGGGVVPPTKLGTSGGGGGGGGGTVTSITAGAGLSGGVITTAGTIAVNLTTTTCSAGQTVTAISALGVGTCSTFFNTAGTGLSATGSTVNVNLTTTSCSAGSAETATAANGTSTCSAVVTSMAGSASEGLACSTTSGAATCGLIQTCSTGQIVDWNGTNWVCTNFVNAGGTNLSVTGDTLSLNLPGSTCTGGQAVVTVSASGTTTCGSVGGGAGTVTSVTCSTGLSCTASNPITASGTIAVNLTTTSCTAGQAVTAISAAGVGTCTTLISGTATALALYATTTTLGNSDVTDDGTTIALGSVATVKVATGNTTTGALTASGNVLATGGNSYLNGFGFACGFAQASTQTCLINAIGDNFGTTQFRNLTIEDGKGAAIETITASTKDTSFASTVEVAGMLSANAGATVVGNSSYGAGTWSFIASGILEVKSEIKAAGVAPTLSGCGTGASATIGGQLSSTVTTGTGTVTPCVITFPAAMVSTTPTCIVSTENATKTYTYTRSQTTLTISGAQVSTNYHYICADH